MPEAGESAKAVRFHMIKSPAFRTIHVDGVFGGPTPQGLFNLAFFSERAPIPTIMEHVVLTEDGRGRAKLGEEIKAKRIARDGIVREIEISAVMSVDTAEALMTWLKGHIEKLKASEAGESQ